MRISSSGPIVRLVLHNPNAGLTWRSARTRRVLATLRDLPGTMVVPTRRGEIAKQTRELLSLSPETTSVFACGGDGTVSDVASAIAGTDIALGIVPVGSTNTLAYEFGIPQDPMRAVGMLLQSTARRTLRTWTVGAHRLVLGVGVGWDAQLMWRTPAPLKRSLGYFAFTPIGLALAAAYEFPEIIVNGTDGDGQTVTATGTSVLVTNSRHWAGPRAQFPAADPAADVLQVIVLEPKSLPHLASFWLHMMLPGGTPLDRAGVRVLALRRMTITSTHPGGVSVHVNGDPVAHTPVAIEPSDSVQVIVPELSS